MNAAPIVSRDAIRLAIHGKFFDPKFEDSVTTVEHAMVPALFNAGHDTVIIDNCHLKQRYRSHWEAQRLQDVVVQYCLVRAPRSFCEQACEAKGNKMPEVLVSMAKSMDVQEIQDVWMGRVMLDSPQFRIVDEITLGAELWGEAE